MGDMPAESWWKLITPKEMRAGMNQLNGRKILILDFVSSDMVKIQYLYHVSIISIIEVMIGSVTYIKNPSKESFYVYCCY